MTLNLHLRGSLSSSSSLLPSHVSALSSTSSSYAQTLEALPTYQNNMPMMYGSDAIGGLASLANQLV